MTENDAAGRSVHLTVQVLKMSKRERILIQDPYREVAVLVIEGKGKWTVGEATESFDRKNQFECGCYCVHAAAGASIEIVTETESIFYVQRAENDRSFGAVFYTPAQVENVIAGDKGELNGTMKREIRTVFDYQNAPYSNMVLGEVLNSPGLWSSYPPHHHPQPEVYFYRFDKPQGFGAGFANGSVYKTGQNGFLIIQNGFHSQVSAPGYRMCYIWGIRHLKGDPWIKTRIDDEEHRWLLDAQERKKFYERE